jgi:hypothetical protein
MIGSINALKEVLELAGWPKSKSRFENGDRVQQHP